MAVDREALRDWHRLFGLLLSDLFLGSPFSVELERDLSQQQQLLDVLIIRRGRGKLLLRLPDGLEGLGEHNLLTFKSLREALDAWAMKELICHYVAYRKLVSPAPNDLLPEDRFRLYAVCARFPHNLAGQVPWRDVSAGVYDCQWGTDVVRVIVAGQLPQEEYNAPLHLFSASQELVGFGQGVYRPRSEQASGVLGQLFHSLEGEGYLMSYTFDDFERDQRKKWLAKVSLQELVQALPPEKQREFVQALPPEERLEGLSVEEIQRHLDKLTGAGAAPKPRRKKS